MQRKWVRPTGISHQAGRNSPFHLTRCQKAQNRNKERNCLDNLYHRASILWLLYLSVSDRTAEKDQLNVKTRLGKRETNYPCMYHWPNLRKTFILQLPFAWMICLIVFNSLLSFNGFFFCCCYSPFCGVSSIALVWLFHFVFHKTTRTALNEHSWHVQNMPVTPWRDSIYTKQSCTGKLQRHSEVVSQALPHL